MDSTPDSHAIHDDSRLGSGDSAMELINTPRQGVEISLAGYKTLRVDLTDQELPIVLAYTSGWDSHEAWMNAVPRNGREAMTDKTGFESWRKRPEDTSAFQAMLGDLENVSTEETVGDRRLRANQIGSDVIDFWIRRVPNDMSGLLYTDASGEKRTALDSRVKTYMETDQTKGLEASKGGSRSKGDKGGFHIVTGA